MATDPGMHVPTQSYMDLHAIWKAIAELRERCHELEVRLDAIVRGLTERTE